MPSRTPILRRPITRWTLTTLCIALFATWCATAIAGAVILLMPYSYRDGMYRTQFSAVLMSGAITLERFERPADNPPLPSSGLDLLSFDLIAPRGLVSASHISTITWQPSLRHSKVSEPVWHLSRTDFGIHTLRDDVFFTTTHFTLPLWIPFLLFSLVTWRSWKLHLAHRAALRAHHCPHCNYPRTGLTPSSPCPECGTALTTHSPA